MRMDKKLGRNHRSIRKRASVDTNYAVVTNPDGLRNPSLYPPHAALQ